jgi:hypothetical protein
VFVIDVSDWEVFFVGARTLIGKRIPDMHRPGATECISPVFEMVRAPAQNGIQTMVFPVGWFPVQALAIPVDAMSIQVKSLGATEMRGLAKSVEKAAEMLQQMRAAASGIAIATELPK